MTLKCVIIAVHLYKNDSNRTTDGWMDGFKVVKKKYIFEAQLFGLIRLTN